MYNSITAGWDSPSPTLQLPMEALTWLSTLLVTTDTAATEFSSYPTSMMELLWKKSAWQICPPVLTAVSATRLNQMGFALLRYSPGPTASQQLYASLTLVQY